MDRRRRIRVGAVVVVLLLGLGLGVTNASEIAGGEGDWTDYAEQASLPGEEKTAIAPPRENATAVVSQTDGLFVVAPNGTVLFHDSERSAYFDVDPAPTGSHDLLLTTVTSFEGDGCTPLYDRCAVQYLERVNYSTGERTVLFRRTDPQKGAAEWHDADRVGPDEYVVADMFRETVFEVNTTTDIATWEWNLQTDQPITSGGPFPRDWSHLNDVELVRDPAAPTLNDTYMVSLRNHDQVVFVDRETGDVVDRIGRDDARDIMYEQHNPDYIPAARGGPAVVIADSQNNRLVEYQREDGQWRESWVWRDRTMAWPRDADRLPNGHTLVADSNADRVIELNESGGIVWSVPARNSYDVERLGTGDESAGGSSAEQAGLASRRIDSADISGAGQATESAIRSLVPAKVLNALTYVTPGWVDTFDFAGLALLLVTLLGWGAVELKWSPWRLRLPVYRRE
jgi:hypothetical protein